MTTLPTQVSAQELAAPTASSHHYRYRAVEGDTLIGLGTRLLQRPNDWTQLARLNNIRNPRRIPVGSVIRIPFDLLKTTPAPAKVVAIEGLASVQLVGQSEPVPLHNAAQVDQGQQITTDGQGYATIELPDGSTLHIQPDTTVVLERSVSHEGTGVFSTTWRLIKGRVESMVQRVRDGKPRYEIQTPQATMGVRGTVFRTAASGDTSTSEVLSGVVAAAPNRAPSTATRLVNAGQGTWVRGRTTEVVPLLPAPDLASWPNLHERLLVKGAVAPVAGAQGYRAQVARDGGFREVVAEQQSPLPQFKLAGLPDGHYHLRVRAIDARVLEGMDASRTFTLKARPEPPIPSTPSPQARLRSRDVLLSWAEQPQAHRYRLHINDANGNLVVNESALIEPRYATTLPAGHYRWRLASQAADGDLGPWGDAQGFELREPPADLPPPVVDAHELKFAWSGEPGQRFEFQMGLSPDFSTPLADQTLPQPQITLPKPEAGGRLFVRYRAIDPDGFVGPYTSPQIIELPPCAQDLQGQCLRGRDDAPVRSR